MRCAAQAERAYRERNGITALQKSLGDSSPNADLEAALHFDCEPDVLVMFPSGL